MWSRTFRFSSHGLAFTRRTTLKWLIIQQPYFTSNLTKHGLNTKLILGKGKPPCAVWSHVLALMSSVIQKHCTDAECNQANWSSFRFRMLCPTLLILPAHGGLAFTRAFIWPSDQSINQKLCFTSNIWNQGLNNLLINAAVSLKGKLSCSVLG